jgi:hypothetical protein
LNELFFRSRRKLEVDLVELESEGESLSRFLRSRIKANVTLSGNKISIESEELPPQELKRLVTKFIYRGNLSNRYWVALENDEVKIYRFKAVEKREKRKRETTPPSTIKHGW